MEANTSAEIVVSDFSATRDVSHEGLKPVGRVVHHNGSPNFLEVSVVLDPGYDVRPGQFLAVWHGKRDVGVFTVIQVRDCLEINPNEDPQLAVARQALGLGTGYAGEGTSTRIFRIATCDTIEELKANYSKPHWTLVESRSPELLARAGDPVVLLPGELSADVVGGLKETDKGIHVGEIFGSSDVPITLPPAIFQMHVGVFGNPGKGKSYLSGILVEEAQAWDIPTLILDVNGETAKAAESLGGLVITLPDKKRFGLALELLTPPELVSVTPNVQPNTQYGELIHLAHDYVRNESRGAHISFDTLIKRVEDLGTTLKITASSVRAAVSRLSVLKDDPLIGQSFDFIEKLKEHKVVVLDCRFLSLRQTQLIAAAGARVLQGYGRKMARAADEQKDTEAAKWFSLFYIDEAHAVVPNEEDVVSTQVIYELARMGRHVRTGLILASQSPSDLDRSVLKRLQTRFVFALEKDQLSAIGGITADLNERIIAQLPKLPRGTCAVSGSSELIRHGFILKVKPRKTPVGGGTPPIFASRIKQH